MTRAANKLISLVLLAASLGYAACQDDSSSTTTATPSGLVVGYYTSACPRAEKIVRAAVQSAVGQDPGAGAGLIRMLFFDCFVEGCDASVLLDPTPANPQPEKLGVPTLRGFEVVDAAKAALEAECPGKVSCADVVAFAARDAAFYLSNSTVSFAMPGGRYDGRRSVAATASDGTTVPAPSTADLSQLLASFAAKGLSAEDMVALLGAHSVGRSHCSAFKDDRLYSPTGADIDPAYADALRQQCPASLTTGDDPTVAQDVVTPDTLDTQYFNNVLGRKVLFASDAALLTSDATSTMVFENAFVQGKWVARFKAAMLRMAAVDVKTAADGEIRTNCRFVN